MVFRRFRLQVVLRVILIVVTILLIFLLHDETAYAVSTIILALLLLVQVISLIRYTEPSRQKTRQ